MKLKSLLVRVFCIKIFSKNLKSVAQNYKFGVIMLSQSTSLTPFACALPLILNVRWAFAFCSTASLRNRVIGNSIGSCPIDMGSRPVSATIMLRSDSLALRDIRANTKYLNA